MFELYHTVNRERQTDRAYLLLKDDLIYFCIFLQKQKQINKFCFYFSPIQM